MPTITDVARKAGVSTSTVSHVINETRYVSDQVKQRVHAAMKDLNYQPNVIARSLRTRETQTVGVVVSDITNPFFTNIVRAIEDEVLKQGYNIILCDTDEKPEREQVYLRLLMGRRVDGLIVAPSSGNADLLQLAIESGYPTVLLDRSIPGLDADVVLSDNEGGAFDAVSYLVGIGHRRIGIIAGRLEVSTVQTGWRGMSGQSKHTGSRWMSHLSRWPSLSGKLHMRRPGRCWHARNLPPRSLCATMR